MKKIFLFTILTLSTSVLMAQVCGGGGGSGSSSSGASSFSAGSGTFNSISNLQQQVMMLKLTVDNSSYSNYKLAYKDISGTPYLNEEKVNGYLVLNDGTVIENVPLQYDLYSKDIVAENRKGEEVAIDRRIFKEVGMNIEGRLVVFKKANPKHKDTFYEILHESDDVVFYKSHKAALQEGRNLGVTYVGPEFKKRSDYYVSQQNGGVAKVSLKKKKINKFIEAFPEIEAVAMREYIKKHKINFNKEKDYIEMLANVDKE